MVERFPRNRLYQTIYRVIPGKRMLDPGSSLLKPKKYQTQKQARPITPIRGSLGVAKSVCHRDRRSLPNSQLRCL